MEARVMHPVLKVSSRSPEQRGWILVQGKEREQVKDSQLRQLMWNKIVLTCRIVSELF
jgi:hypothetical protein